MIIRDLLNMKGNVITSIAPTETVSKAVHMMVENDIGSLVVIKGGEMIGMLTFREVLQTLHRHEGNLGKITVSEVMVANPVMGHPNDTLDHMRQVMTEQHIRYLPIKEDANLLGVVSFHDVAKAVVKEVSFENRLLKSYIKNWPEEDAEKK
jgi:CBS domain-containing protein